MTPPGSRPKLPAARTALVLAALVVATAVTYRPTWHGGPLWDDDAHMTRPDLQSGEGLRRIWFDLSATQQYYPVSHTAFWLLHRAFGDRTTGYHLVNIALHSLSAFLLFLILRQLSIPGALVAATAFALHPVHVESVAWITELKNTLSGVLYLGAALAMTSEVVPTKKRTNDLRGLLLFVLALLSKTVTATLPAVLLIIAWWRRGRLRWREDVVPLVPFFVLGAAAGLTTAWVERSYIGATGAAFDLTPIERVLVAGRAWWFYLGKLVWPTQLTFIYPRWTIDATIWWQYLFPLAAAAVLVAAWMLRRTSRAPLAALLVFSVTLVPALGFFNVYPFIYSFVADHFQYLASIPVIVLCAAGLVRLFSRWTGVARWRELALAVAIGVPLAALSWKQSHLYASADVLYRATIEANPSCWMAYNNLGELALRDRTDRSTEAAALFEESLRLNPENAAAHNNLGLVRARQGRFEEALHEHQVAARLEPRNFSARNNLGADLLSLGRLDEAIAELSRVIGIVPNYAEAQHNLGSALLQAGRPRDAVPHLERAIEIDPRYANAHDSLGNALQQLGQFSDALTQYRDAIRLRPDVAQFHNNAGMALHRLGRYQEAVAQYSEALRLQPDVAVMHVNLGDSLVKIGQVAEALAEFRTAIRLDPGPYRAYYSLANGLVEARQASEAIAQFELALRHDPGQAAASIHNDLGVALAILGRMGDAVREFREALRLQPDLPDARENLARALKQK